MKKWTSEKAFETIHRLSAKTAETATMKQLDLMRRIFVQITVFGCLRYSSSNFQVWEDENGDLAIIDRVLGEASIVYNGWRYILERGDEG